MGTLGEVLVGLAIGVGLVGMVLPVLPGLLLVAGSVVLWAAIAGGAAWWVALAAVVLAGVGLIVKYAIPKRQLDQIGVPVRTVLLATIVAVVGFFAIPLIGAPLGFVLTILLFERARVGPERAWPATWTALRALATSIGIDLATGLVIASIWLAAVLLT